jgi:Ca-activated chloride channel family protein
MRGLTAFTGDTYTDFLRCWHSEGIMTRAVFVLLAVLSSAVLTATVGAVVVNGQASSRERTLYASVVDKNGEPVSGLGPDEFIVREDKVRREVLRVSRATEPIAIALLVDNSASADADIRNIRDGLTKFVEQMRTGNDIALIGLADRPTILQDYTRNGELLKSGIGRLFAQPGSGMMLLDAIVDASRGLGKRDEPRAAIVAILTEGTEFSNLHYTQVLEPLKQSQAALHALTIGTFAATTNDALRNRASVLDSGPRQSGGQRVTLLSSMAVGAALEKLGRELSNQYKIVYGRSESLIQPEAVTVGVTRPGLTARGTPERRK